MFLTHKHNSADISSICLNENVILVNLKEQINRVNFNNNCSNSLYLRLARI